MSNATRFDVIVVGSGLGGMVAAVALARTVKKMLLREKSDVLGGQTLRFSREGFSWDPGLHYFSGQDACTPGIAGAMWVDCTDVQTG